MTNDELPNSRIAESKMNVSDVTDDPLPTLAARAVESHKGDFGRVLIVGGSRGMAGAPALAGMAALRSGAGLVTVAVPASIQSIVASFEPSYMTIGLGSDADYLSSNRDIEDLSKAAKKATALAIGPGLSNAPATVELVCQLYSNLNLPMIVDADGLNALSQNLTLLQGSLASRILTPHPGEFTRLTGEEYVIGLEQRAEQAAKLASQDKSAGTIVVLKGHQTIVTDGQRYAVNTTGNPGMATGGTGDCLTGIITALTAQGLTPWEAARLGVHVHGLAGDMAAAELGEVSLIASDLIHYLPQAFQKVAPSSAGG